jgi:quinol monooxygenase YgiN
MSVIVVATVRPRPEQRAEVIGALEKAIGRAHTEDAGCLLTLEPHPAGTAQQGTV